MNIHIFYRLANQPAAQPKEKLTEATKEACLQNCADVFGSSRLTVFGDRLDKATKDMVDSLGIQLIEVNEGSGGGTFRRAAREAMEMDDSEVVYLLEDDFLHLPHAPEAIMDGLGSGASYVTLYDHPDKYIDGKMGGNPPVKDGGEATRLLCGNVCHWKITNSTVMTFASTVGQLRHDWNVFLKYCPGRYTDDYKLFRTLRRKGRTLLSSVPGAATHCESKFLSPFTDWTAIAKKPKNNVQTGIQGAF